MDGFFAFGFEMANHGDQDWGELSKTLNSFSGHNKNVLGIAWTGTITGGKKGGKSCAWSAQKHLKDSNDHMVTYGGRIYCVRAKKAFTDGFFIDISRSPPDGYNPQNPFRLAN